MAALAEYGARVVYRGFTFRDAGSNEKAPAGRRKATGRGWVIQQASRAEALHVDEQELPATDDPALRTVDRQEACRGGCVIAVPDQ